jgi:ATP-dependent helicase HrpB
MRVPRFSPSTGMSRLETLRITRDRADQRRGRAGRLCPGICYRLWDAVTDQQLSPEALPEIYDADLAPTVLQSADWGTAARDGLPWLTPPPDAAWRYATALLQELGALTHPQPSGRRTPDAGLSRPPTADCRLPTADCRLPLPSITPRGRAMVKVPAHPRLAHMIFEAAHAGCAQHACLLAAALTEAAADPTARYETDARRLLDRLEHAARDGFAQRVRELARRWGHAYPAQDRAHLSEGLLLAWAFPDRLGRRRDSAGHYLLRSGRGATLDTSELLAQSEWLVAAELQDDTTDAKIRLAAPLTREEIDDAFGQEYESRSLTSWDKRTESVQAVNRVCLGSIVIKEGGQARPDPADLLAALFEGIRQKGIDQLPWSKSSRALQARICFLHRTLPEQTWPDLSDAELLANLVAWLGPYCDGVTRWPHVQALDLTSILLNRLDTCGGSRRLLDELAPTHLPVPSGSSIQVRYDQDAPYMEVRIQEVFGLTQTPRVAGGRVPVVMHLLSPAQRPVQVTRDLESFWATGYAYVRKDLRGRYPKHYWPEDPREATPTHRVRPRPS